MQSQKVLLLENVAAQAAGVQEALVKSGYRVSISRYESDGLKKLQEWSPDIIVLSTTYSHGSFLDFCRRLKADAARPIHLVITSALTKERLYVEQPGLESLVDAFIIRPYGPMELIRVLRGLGGRIELAGAPEKKEKQAGKLVLVLDADPAVYKVLHQALEPRGVEVVNLKWEETKSFCRTRRPQVLILGWPVPEEFFSDVLQDIRESNGRRPLSVLLFSDAGREIVTRKSPALLQAVDMLFTKPVVWEYFFRVLSRLLEIPDLQELRMTTPSPVSEEQGLRARFQREVEAKYLEVEELKHRLAAAEKRGVSETEGLEELRRLQEENRQLHQQIQKVKRKAELDLAMGNLKETDLEVKLDNLLRMKDESERRAQDLIDAGHSKAEDLQKALDDVRAEQEARQKENAALRADLERALVEKEQAEEKFQATDLSWKKEKESLRPLALEADLARERELRAEDESRWAEELRVWKERGEEGEKKVGELLRRCDQLEGEVESGAKSNREQAARLRELEGSLRAREEELTGLRARLQEEEARGRELGEEQERQRLQAEKEKEDLETRYRQLERDLAGERGAKRAMEEEYHLQLLEESEKRKLLEQQLAEASRKAEMATVGSEEYQKVQQLLQEVISRAQTEVVARTRKEVELESQLHTALEEKKSILERSEKELTEAAEREKRLTALLESSLGRVAEPFPAPAGTSGVVTAPDNLPATITLTGRPAGRRRVAVAAGLAVVLLGGAIWVVLKGFPRLPIGEVVSPPAVQPPSREKRLATLAGPRETWEKWTRSDISGSVLFQATLRSEEEVRAEVEAEKRSRGWSEEKAQDEYRRLIEPYHFDQNFYFYLYLKNLQPGNPAYLDDIYSRLYLRDDQGHEARAHLPEGLEKYRSVYSFSSGELSKGRAELIYEVAIPVAFSRENLSPDPAYIQLLAYDIGATSRRVLTWELE